MYQINSPRNGTMSSMTIQRIFAAIPRSPRRTTPNAPTSQATIHAMITTVTRKYISRATLSLVVDACDEVLALQDLHVDAAEAHVVARVPRIEHLVTGLDAAHVRADCGDDSGSAGSGLRRGGGEDEACPCLRLVGDRLHDDELVERFQRDVDPARLVDHGRTIRPPTATDLVRAARPVYRRMRPPPAGVSQRVWSFLIVPFDQSWASALLTHARSVDPCSKTSA